MVFFLLCITTQYPQPVASISALDVRLHTTLSTRIQYFNGVLKLFIKNGNIEL